MRIKLGGSNPISYDVRGIVPLFGKVDYSRETIVAKWRIVLYKSSAKYMLDF